MLIPVNYAFAFSKKLKDYKNNILSQHNIFHSILDFLAIGSPIYDENMSVFKK